MSLHESQYGRDGIAAENSAISGKKLQAGDAFFQINGYSLGIQAREFRSISAAEFDALKAEWASDLPAAKSAPGTTVPAYDEMDMDALKALAAQRGVDIAGRRSKEALKQSLRAAEVRERFAPAPEAVEGQTPLDLTQTVGE